jgi:hypothetical protein
VPTFQGACGSGEPENLGLSGSMPAHRPGMTGKGLIGCRQTRVSLRVFSSEVETGSREENASKQESRAPVLIQSEPEML